MSFINSYNLKVIEDTLNTVHPKQIINKVDNLKITLFKIKYEYNTNRGNKKQGEKYLLLPCLNPQVNLREELDDYIENYNESNKHRQISNVKFLDGQCLGYIHI